MATLKVTCARGGGKGFAREMTNASIEPQGSIVFLTLDTNEGSVKYRLWAERDAPSSIVITRYLHQEISAVMDKNGTLDIREDPERSFLHIGRHLGPQKRFSGERI